MFLMFLWQQNIRQQAMSTLNMWVEQVGLKETVDGEVFADALKSGSPFLKSELFTWMAEKLKDGKFNLWVISFLSLL